MRRYINTPIQELNLSRDYLRSVNSQLVIRQIHQYKRSIDRHQLIARKQLQKEIRKTNYKVKKRRYFKPTILSASPQNTTPQIPLSTPLPNHSNSISQQISQKPFSQSTTKRRIKIKNAYLKSKMKVFGSSITDRTKAAIENQISREVARIGCRDQRKTVSSGGVETSQNWGVGQGDWLDGLDKLSRKLTTKQIQNQQKVKKYTICHMILQKLLQLMTKNPQNLQLKQCQTYTSLKEQMVHTLTDTETLSSILARLSHSIQLATQHQTQFIFSKARLKKLQAERKQMSELKMEMKDQLSQQIEAVMDGLRQMIEGALKGVHRPEVAYDLQMGWERRRGNFLGIGRDRPGQGDEDRSNADERLNRTQNCLRTTTIKRLNYF